MFTKQSAHVPTLPSQRKPRNSQRTFEVAHAAGKFLRGDISHRREHRDATMLELSLTTALEVLYAAISCESGRVPKVVGACGSNDACGTATAWEEPASQCQLSEVCGFLQTRLRMDHEHLVINLHWGYGY